MATLGEQVLGNIVYINESGSPVEFYVACHDYESALNGAGRTLLVRKECTNMGKWGGATGASNTYDTGALDAWLNSDYVAMLDDNIKVAAETTTFYYTVGGGNTTVTTFQRAVFALSIAELAPTKFNNTSTYNTEGSALPIADTLRLATKDGTASSQWTRTPTTNLAMGAMFVNAAGNGESYLITSSYPYRPCLTLPASMTVDGGATS